MQRHKNRSFQVWTEQPFNGEPPLDLLCRSGVTPNDLFYTRNHGAVPDIHADEYRLRVEGFVERSLDVSLAELRERFGLTSVTATLSCAGNRRTQLTEVREIPGEVRWRDGAIGNATWAGVRLADVLRDAGLSPEARHVAFTGADEVDEDGEIVNFGGSIPLEQALAPDTLLATEMNGELLPREHGFPLRVVVPGYIGARSVKWLTAIVVQAKPSTNYFQTRSYRIFPPDVIGDPDWEHGLVLGEISVNSAICVPTDGAELAPGRTAVEGWAFAGGRRLVGRVDVSPDGGETWTQAELLGANDPTQWRLWRAELELGVGEHELVSRAWDSAANTQPADPAEVWNVKGYVNNAWHRVRVTATT